MRDESRRVSRKVLFCFPLPKSGSCFCGVRRQLATNLHANPRAENVAQLLSQVELSIRDVRLMLRELDGELSNRVCISAPFLKKIPPFKSRKTPARRNVPPPPQKRTYDARTYKTL